MASCNAYVSETRALAHKLCNQCRETSSRFQELTVDLRKLRNLLEDVEEDLTHDGSLDSLPSRISSQILQCKAILCGLDLSFQSFRCSAWERQKLQSGTIPALRASIQHAAHGLSVASADLAAVKSALVPDHRNMLGTGSTRHALPFETTSNVVPMTSDVTLSLDDPVRPSTLCRHRLPQQRGSSQEHIHHGYATSDQSPDNTSDPFVSPEASNSWYPPFTSPDPLSVDHLEACTMLTDYSDGLEDTAPKIIVTSNGSADFNEILFPTKASFDGVEPGTSASGLPQLSHDRSKRCHSGVSTPSSMYVRAGYSPTASDANTYLPYRPWYSSPSGMNSHTVPDITDALCHDRSLTNSIGTAMSEVLPPSLNAKDSAIFQTAESSSEVLQDKADQIIPPMPTRPPPPPQSFVRNKRRPPVPPRPRACLLANSPISIDRVLSIAGASPTAAPPASKSCGHARDGAIASIDPLPYLAELKHVLEPETAVKRRASTGDMSMSAPIVPGSKQGLSIRAAEMLTVTQTSSKEVCPSQAVPALAKTTHVQEHRPSSQLPELAAEPLTGYRHTDTITTDGSRESDRQYEVEQTDLENTRMRNMCDSWNSRNWPQAESYLTLHLSKLNCASYNEAARKTRHLLGVCASYRGQWHRALVQFISVVRTPVQDLQQLDNGDGAAFYWLGDTYTLLDRKEEALLAYYLAGSCNRKALRPELPASHRCPLAEQERLRQFVSESSFNAAWSEASTQGAHAPGDGLLHPAVANQDIAQMCLLPPNPATQSCNVHDLNEDLRSQHAVKASQLSLQPSHLEASSVWPIPYDVTFILDSVVQGSLQIQHIDLINELQQRPGTLHFSKRLSPSLNSTAFVSLDELITTLREALPTLAMEWHEVVSTTGVFFIARYHTIQDSIMSTNYFRLEIVKLPLHALAGGFGLSLCTESIRSARWTKAAFAKANDDDAVDAAAATKKELKRCLRAAIKTIQARRQRLVGPTSPSSPRPLPATSMYSPYSRPSPRPPPLPLPTRNSTAASTSPAELGSTSAPCSSKSSVEAPPLPPPKDSTDPSASPAELEAATPTPTPTPSPSPSPSPSTPQSSIDLSTLVPPRSVKSESTRRPTVSDGLQIAESIRARISMRSSYNELHLLGGLSRS